MTKNEIQEQAGKKYKQNDRLVSIWTGETEFEGETRYWMYIKRCGKTVNFGWPYTNYVVKRLIQIYKEKADEEDFQDLKTEIQEILNNIDG